MVYTCNFLGANYELETLFSKIRDGGHQSGSSIAHCAGCAYSHPDFKDQKWFNSIVLHCKVISFKFLELKCSATQSNLALDMIYDGMILKYPLFTMLKLFLPASCLQATPNGVFTGRLPIVNNIPNSPVSKGSSLVLPTSTTRVTHACFPYKSSHVSLRI